ncbi:MAG: hypothetical protein GF353_26215 [Candidatus Lokiarchaeota archaeon]|nr:hypothetical protein [Candidatus Lokiarchaeota archaeon]
MSYKIIEQKFRFSFPRTDIANIVFNYRNQCDQNSTSPEDGHIFTGVRLYRRAL